MKDNSDNKSVIDYKLIAIVIFTTAFTGLVMYEIWVSFDPSYCVRKICLVWIWGIRSIIIGVPVGIAITIIRIIRQPLEAYKEPEKSKEEPFDYSKLGANNN